MRLYGRWPVDIAADRDEGPVRDIEHRQRERQRSVSEPHAISGRVEEELGMTSRVALWMSHLEVCSVRDLPPGIDQAPGKIGFLKAVVERAAKATDLVERRASHEARATRKRRRGRRALGILAQPGDMAASGPAVLVDHAEPKDAEPIVGGELLDGGAEDVTVECAIVVKETEQRARACGRAAVASLRNAEVLARLDDDVGERPVGIATVYDQHDLDVD